MDGTNKTTAHLTETQKNNIKAISQLGAAAAGGVIGDSSQSAVSSAQIAKRAVENNFFDIILNNPQSDWVGAAEGEQARIEAEKFARERFAEEHPILHKTEQGIYYFISKTGKAIYISRELALELAPMVLASQISVGTKAYTFVSNAALSGSANIIAQKASGQDFNWSELGGAVVSGGISPNLKKTAEVIRFNMGVGMATGLANGSDGLSEAALSGVAAYGGTKISNPVAAAALGEVIQKLPNINNSVNNNGDNK